MPAPRRVLVKEVNWLGDLIMSLPALRAVRRAWPQAELAVLVKRELASFFDGAQWVERVIPYSVARGWRGIADRGRIVREIRQGGFDLAVLFPDSFQAALWAALGGVPRRAGYAREGRGFLLTDKACRPSRDPARHRVHYRLHMLRATLGIEGDPDAFVPDVHEPHRQRMRTWLVRRGYAGRAPLVALAPAAAYRPAKEWPAGYYSELMDLLAARHGGEFVLVGAAGERPRCEQIAAASRCGAIVAAGEITVGEAMALLTLCSGLVGNDSGATHLAAALGVPTVGIYGSTAPSSTGPPGPRAKVIYRQLECSPCLRRTCRLGHYDCLRGVGAAEVASALEDLGGCG